MKKKRIFAMVIAMAVMLSSMMLVSCNGEEAEDLGELMSITVTVSATAASGGLLEGQPISVTLEDYASNLTVLAATREALRIAEVSFTTGGTPETITSIAGYSNSDIVEIPYDGEVGYEEDENGEEEEAEENEAEETAYEEGRLDYFWIPRVNGAETSSSTLIADGAVIEWEFIAEDWN